jgi:O-antigen/teichoic acid export membrane protein
MISRLLQLGKESAVYGLSTVLGRLVAVFLVPVYTRVFTPEDYGVIAMVTTILTLVGVFVGLGAEAGFTVSYYDDEDEVRRGALVLNYVFLQLITAVGVGGVLFLVSDTVAQAFLGSAERDIYIRIAALTVVAGCLNQVAFNLFRNARKPWVLVALNTSVSLLQLGLSVVVVSVPS